MASFVDRVVLHAAGGNGGHGVASIRREKFKPLAGPDATPSPSASRSAAATSSSSSTPR